MLAIWALASITGFASFGMRRSLQATCLVALVAATLITAAFHGSSTHMVMVQGLATAFLFVLGSASTGLRGSPDRRSMTMRIQPDLL